MKILKTISYILLVSLTAVSCSKDDDEVTPVYQPRTNLLLKTTDSDDGLISTYTYDTNNRLVNYKLNGNAFNAARDHNFTYNADGSLNEIREASGGALVMKYFYSLNGKVVKKEGRNGLDVYNYSYSGNTVNENYTFTVDNTGFRNVYTYDTNGNVATETYYTNVNSGNPLGTFAQTITQTFDTKNSATSSLPAAYLFPTSVNNLIKMEYSGGGSLNIGYEYNIDNYPTKRMNGYNRIYEYIQL